jgi:hypothetical protein
MLNFPQPYEDEIVGSTIIRACRRLGLSLSTILEALYDDDTRRLNTLVISPLARLAALSGILPTPYLWRHTLFPYTAGFLPMDKVMRLQHHLILTSRPDTQRSLSHAIHPFVRHLRFCTVCRWEDQLIQGESYWHRQHQLPGLYYCCRHGIPLKESLIPTQQASPKYLRLPHEVAEYRAMPQLPPPEIRSLMTELSAKLVRGERCITSNPATAYREAVEKSGYGIDQAYVSPHPFNRALHQFYGSEFLRGLRLDFVASSATAWPTAMLKPDSFVSHTTIKHLLLVVFLSLKHSALNQPSFISPPTPTR